MFESLGNHWNQVNIFRPDGYPYYHYLQTEKGTGRIEVRGKFYTLGANEGILIAPGVPHSYHRESTSHHNVCHLHRNTGRQHPFHDR